MGQLLNSNLFHGKFMEYGEDNKLKIYKEGKKKFNSNVTIINSITDVI